MITTRPTFTAVFASTIDGRITDHEGHFHNWGSEEDHAFFQRLIPQYDAIVVGRVTYEHLSKRAGFPRPMFVITKDRDLIKRGSDVQGIDVATADIAHVLQQQAYKNILVIGGTKTYSYFLERGLLDEVFVTIEPLTFGQGQSAFSHAHFHPSRFSLIACKPLNSHGTILLHYRCETIPRMDRDRRAPSDG